MKSYRVYLIVMGVFLTAAAICSAEQVIVSHKTDTAVVMDGKATDRQWGEAQAIEVKDDIADITVALKSVYTDQEVFFLVTFPDPDESRKHKTIIWHKEQQIYKVGPAREDVFILKWNMEPMPVDLSIFSDNSYVADIWFWKACRTDPVSYADDKIQMLSRNKLDRARKLTSRSGRTMYLKRMGDEGKQTYMNRLIIDYVEDEMARFEIRQPEGSRADIRAKGEWSQGMWTIEFGRKLKTGHNDDIQFEPGQRYQFGISRYEIAGRRPEPKSSQPLYGTGDTGELLNLTFGPNR